MAGEQPLSQTEVLEKLEKVGNLESVVTEQRMRMEKLKTTYEMLKAEHIQLQEVCVLKSLFSYMHELNMLANMLAYCRHEKNLDSYETLHVNPNDIYVITKLTLCP
jgi:FtsZ-binding cell division protein ZapB